MNWKLNKIQYPIYNLGPGRRIGIWVQGCTLACEGCVNQTLWNKEKGANAAVADIFNWIISVAENFDGITISGGEPFQQYAPLIAFSHLIKQKTRMNIYCFSGYYLDELNELFPDRLFYRYLDYLVDGRYVAGRHENRNVKGSANQTLYHFADGVPVRQEADFANNKWSVQINNAQEIFMAGIPQKNELNYISTQLAKAGIEKIFK
jgi:anaerobic ribonucleoside-triphosphate reductase activating protein